MVTFERIYEAYLNCKKKKGSCSSALQFSYGDLCFNIDSIVEDINNRCYVHSSSSCFVITYPTIREIYAAQFRDRVVQHFFIQEMADVIDSVLVDTTTSCRTGKGTDYALKKLKEFVEEESDHGKCEAYFLKIDLNGYFMSIQRPTITKLMIDLINDKYTGNYKDELLYLTPIIFMNNPSVGRIIKCNELLLNVVPERKRMFPDSDCGMAIGNITAQVGSNLNLNEFDRFCIGLGFAKYVRYVDDIIIVHKDKTKLLELQKKAVGKLAETGQKINTKKTIIDSVYHGVKFLGRITYPYGYQKQAKASAGRVINAARTMTLDDKLLSRLNSQLGRFRNYACHNLLIDYMKALPPEVWRYVTYNDLKRKFERRKNYGRLRHKN